MNRLTVVSCFQLYLTLKYNSYLRVDLVVSMRSNKLLLTSEEFKNSALFHCFAISTDFKFNNYISFLLKILEEEHFQQGSALFIPIESFF
jgi:hypothetical protein